MKLKLIGITLFAAGCGACGTFGPERDPPAMVSPVHFAIREQPRDLPEADGVRQHLDAGIAPAPDWWRAYGSDALDALVEEGLANSPSLAAARSALEAAKQALHAQIGRSLWPGVDVGLSPSRQRALILPNLPQPTYLYNVFAAEVQTSYTFDFFGASVLANRSLARQVQQQDFQFEAVRRALATNIVVATIEVASLQAQVTATEEWVALGERRAGQIAARYRLGNASRDDMLSAEQDAAITAASLPPLRAQALAARHAQAVLLGRSPDRAPEPLPLDSLRLPEQLPATVASDLLHRRPDILAAEAAVRASAEAAGAVAAALFPSLTLSATYGRGGFDWSTLTSPAGAIWNVGAMLTQPLFHGGALRARKRQYEANYAAAISEYRQTVLSAFQNVADTLVSLEEDANSLAQTRRAMDSADAVERDTEAKFRLGAAPQYATLTARQQYDAARVQYLRARAARLADTAALYDALGDTPAAAIARLP